VPLHTYSAMEKTSYLQYWLYSFFLFSFFLVVMVVVVLGFKLKALCLLGRHSIA
jgi:hypothetical protein